MACVFVRWHGGANYSESYAEDTEHFRSMRAAQDALFKRYSHGWQPVDFHYVHKSPESVAVPCVDMTSRMDLYSGPTDMAEFIGRIEFGPRGAVRVTWS